ncbi:MAG TPA: helix-turn-helix transcriptional regulator [Terracidiphilus sp.]|nr:helix-turn-helix transcriptional regulator [Terracidiphilus sp.]
MALELGIWELAVLALLREGPMHPYQMQSLLRMRHKDEILALKRGSLYHAIARVEKAGLIAIEATGRNGRRPERTIYRITETGKQAMVETLRRMVAEPRRGSSEFMASMSFLVYLPPAEAAEKLAERAQVLESQIAAEVANLSRIATFLPRIHLIENQYLTAMLEAELAWVRGLEKDLRAGRLEWNVEQILAETQAERARAAEPKSKAERTKQ